MSVSLSRFVCPRGTNISYTQERGGGQTFLTHRREGGTNIFTLRGGANIFASRGGQTFYVGGGGAYDDVVEEMDVS